MADRVSSSKRLTHILIATIRSLKIEYALAMWTNRRVVIRSLIAPSVKEVRMAVDQRIRLSTNSVFLLPVRLEKQFSRILRSIFSSGYSCMNVTGNRSSQASSIIVAAEYRPSLEPRPLVLAVATMLNPETG